jgi:hypothetical protein
MSSLAASLPTSSVCSCHRKAANMPIVRHGNCTLPPIMLIYPWLCREPDRKVSALRIFSDLVIAQR